MLPSVLRRYIHLSLVPALIVAAPGVKASPSALSRVRLTPEIKAAHPAQSSRTSAHQNQKVTSSRHPFIFGTSAPIHLSLARFGTLPSFHRRHASSVPELVFLHQSAFGILDSARKIPRFHRRRYKVRLGTSELFAKVRTSFGRLHIVHCGAFGLCSKHRDLFPDIFGQVNSSSHDFG